MKRTLSIPEHFGVLSGKSRHQTKAGHTPVPATHFRVAIAASLVLVLSFLATSVARGATATSTMAISATVVATCTVSATPMSFGTYNSALLTGTATVTATCSNTTAYNIGLNAGTASGATVTTRGMFVAGTPGVVLNYALYSNSSRTTNWGTTAGTDTVSGTGNGSAQALTVYGQIPAGQLVAPGTYTDTITATITY